MKSYRRNKSNSKKKFQLNPKIIFKASLLVAVAVSYVWVRMQIIEHEYQEHSLSKIYHKEIMNNKELKAQKAELLSIDRLRAIAKSHNLREPEQAQIIVIPK